MRCWQLIKVLRGVKPADIPAEQPTELELGINLQTAEKLGLDVPEGFFGACRSGHPLTRAMDRSS